LEDMTEFEFGTPESVNQFANTMVDLIQTVTPVGDDLCALFTSSMFVNDDVCQRIGEVLDNWGIRHVTHSDYRTIKVGWIHDRDALERLRSMVRKKYKLKHIY
jgi:hypothetical protein